MLAALMPQPNAAKLDAAEQVPEGSAKASGQDDAMVRLGGWLFKHRTSLPIPLALALVLIPSTAQTTGIRTFLVAAGVLMVLAGEGLRFWGVHHIGTISRTRSDRLGPLVDSGPFSMVRNPLYLGNILLWAGFAAAAGLAWMIPVVVLILGLEYHAIVRWEERLLESRLGDAYRRYQQQVPRWIPRRPHIVKAETTAPFSWAETAFSERGTLIAIALGFALLALKNSVI
jgi:protein-S-isoprenylcysteine O-methyltransferase Ste14